MCECFASGQAQYDKAYQLHLPADEAQQMRLSSPEVLMLKPDSINLTASFRQASVHVYHFVEAICRWMSDTGKLGNDYIYISICFISYHWLITYTS